MNFTRLLAFPVLAISKFEIQGLAIRLSIPD